MAPNRLSWWMESACGWICGGCWTNCRLQGRVLKMRYAIPCRDVPDPDEPMSLTGIGRVLGISRDRVRNLERDGLAGLRRLSQNVQAYVAV